MGDTTFLLTTFSSQTSPFSKLHAPLIFQKHSARHALLCSPNSIKGLAGAPTVLNQWQTLDHMHKLIPIEACNVVSGDTFFVKRIGMLWFECPLPHNLYYVVAYLCSNKLIESVLIQALTEHLEQPIKNKMKVDCPVFILHLLQIALFQLYPKVHRLSGIRHCNNASLTSSNVHCPVLLLSHCRLLWLGCWAIIIVCIIASHIVNCICASFIPKLYAQNYIRVDCCFLLSVLLLAGSGFVAFRCGKVLIAATLLIIVIVLPPHGNFCSFFFFLALL